MSVTGQFVTVRSVPAPGPAVGLSVAGGAPVVGVQYDAVPSLQIEFMCSRNTVFSLRTRIPSGLSGNLWSSRPWIGTKPGTGPFTPMKRAPVCGRRESSGAKLSK